MEKPCFKDKDEYPDDEDLSRILGRVKHAWDAFIAFLGESHPSLTGQWRYYQDGHNWLYKITKKKKTICWVSVYDKKFKTTFYFSGKTEALITASTLEKDYIDQFLHGKRYGKIRSVTVEIKKLADLKATKILITIKEQLK